MSVHGSRARGRVFESDFMHLFLRGCLFDACAQRFRSRFHICGKVWEVLCQFASQSELSGSIWNERRSQICLYKWQHQQLLINTDGCVVSPIVSKELDRLFSKPKGAQNCALQKWWIEKKRLIKYRGKVRVSFLRSWQISYRNVLPRVIPRFLQDLKSWITSLAHNLIKDLLSWADLNDEVPKKSTEPNP